MKAADIETRYNESFQFLQTRKRRQASQLVLLNNLNRGDQNIASTLLLTLFNRVLSTLYDDKLQVKFLPSQNITQDQLNSYNMLAQSDYMEMDKAKMDYDWIWDTLFFGRGYCETLTFNKKRKIMEPTVINPLVFGYDPYFEDPQDWRYYWKWILKSKPVIQKLIKAGMIKDVKIEEIPTGVEEYLWEYKTIRDRATKAVEPASDTRNGDVYQILEFYGYNDEGEKCVYWVDKSFSKILYEEKLDLKDGGEIVGLNGETITIDSKWPIVIKESFRIPHSTVPFSIADLLEDKHRAKSVLLNLAFIAAKDKANPLYWYDPDKVKDVSQFLSRQINQHIPVEGNGADAVGPINTEDPMSAGLLQFIGLLTQEANEPIGTGSAGEPAKISRKETATHDAIDQQLNDMAQSILSKVLQFGEKEFWSSWFHRYALHGPELKDKMANIVGVKGVSTEIIDLSDFHTDYPPGVLVYSAKEAEYKELVMRRDLMQNLPIFAQTMDPDGLRNFYKHVYWPKFLQDPSLIDIMFPKTLDEIKAEDENDQLKKNKLPQVLDTDDHVTHIYTHYMVQPKTWATWFHIAEHEEKLAEKKKQEMVQQSMQQMEQGQVSPQKEQGAESSNQMNATSPLKTALQNNIQK